jgi:hypothetical protein
VQDHPTSKPGSPKQLTQPKETPTDQLGMQALVPPWAVECAALEQGAKEHEKFNPHKTSNLNPFFFFLRFPYL